MATQTIHTFSSPQGYALCRKLIAEKLGYGPHDYQLEGICRALDKNDVLAITPTGSGKTGFLTMYLLVMHAIMKTPSLWPDPPAHFRKDAAMVVICPTKSLEVDMESKFQAAGLSTRVINADTADAARVGDGHDIWTDANHVQVLLLAPEQLSTKGFERLLNDKTFHDRIVALGVDEMHLLNSWGLSFRTSYKDIGGIRMRFKNSPIIIGLSATLRSGAPQQSVCAFLGLCADRLHIIRRSNLRHDIRWVFRTISSSARSMTFPELDWVITEQRHVIIFCRTFPISHRVSTYLSNRAKALVRGGYHNTIPEERIRTHNGLNWESYNTRTMAILHSDSREGWVAVATDTLSVGVDITSTDDVVLYDFQLPDDTDSILQKGGRIRNGVGKNSRVIVYLPKTAESTCAKVLELVDKGAVPTVVKVGQGKKTTPVDVGVARLVCATCIITAVDELYSNPPVDIACTCNTCLLNPPPPRPPQCTCSGCQPEAKAAPSEAPIAHPLRLSSVTKPAKQNGPHITNKMREHALVSMRRLRESIRDGMDDISIVPAEEIFPDELMKQILDEFNYIVGVPELRRIFGGHEHLHDHYPAVLKMIEDLRSEFDTMRAQAKAARSAKARETRRLKKETQDMVIVEETEESSDSELDEEDTGKGDTEVSEHEAVHLPMRIVIPGGRLLAERRLAEAAAAAAGPSTHNITMSLSSTNTQ